MRVFDKRLRRGQVTKGYRNNCKVKLIVGYIHNNTRIVFYLCPQFPECVLVVPVYKNWKESGNWTPNTKECYNTYAHFSLTIGRYNDSIKFRSKHPRVRKYKWMSGRLFYSKSRIHDLIAESEGRDVSI